MIGTDLWVAVASIAAGGAAFVLALQFSVPRHGLTAIDRIRMVAGSVRGETAGAAVRDGARPFEVVPATRTHGSRLSGLDPRQRARTVRLAVAMAAVIAIGATTSWLWSAVFGAVGVVATTIWRRSRARARSSQMQPQILEALDLIAATVKAGFGFTQAIELASRELAEPIAGELRAALREIEFGVPVDDALRSLAVRVDDRDLTLAVSALLIQRKVGGGLYEILHNIAELIRDRARVEGEIRSLTAQARLSARVVGLLPVAIAGMMAVMQPGYIEILITDPMGRTLVVGAALSELTGFWAISRLARIDY